MQRQFSPTAIIALVLWGSTALLPLALAKNPSQTDTRQDGAAMTDESLNKMLEGLGYEPKKLSKGYLISLKKDTWTYYVQLVLSGDGSRIGFNANLGGVAKPEDVTATQWQTLLIDNGNIDPSAFYFDKDTKKLYLHRVLDNRAITPAYIRQQVENFTTNIKETGDDWKFAK